MLKAIINGLTFARFRIFFSYLRIEKMSVNYSTLDVIQVREVFKCSLQQTSFLTQLSYVSPVVVSEHLVSQDGICNLE